MITMKTNLRMTRMKSADEAKDVSHCFSNSLYALALGYVYYMSI